MHAILTLLLVSFMLLPSSLAMAETQVMDTMTANKNENETGVVPVQDEKQEVLFPSEPTAQQPTPEEAMKALVEQGADAFKKGDYKTAAVLFETAFDTNPVDLLLKNAMVAWYKHGNCYDALRVAARLSNFDGAANLNSRVDQEVSTVVDCAVLEARSLIQRHHYRRAQALLTFAMTTSLTDVQSKDVRSLWLTIEPNAVLNPPVTFHSISPWLGVGASVLGVVFTTTGIVYAALKPRRKDLSIPLLSVGAASLLAGTGFFLYWGFEREAVRPSDTLMASEGSSAYYGGASVQFTF